MASFPKFFISENPMAEYGEEYIYHSQKPRFLAKRVHDHSDTDFIIVDDIDDMLAFFNGRAEKVAGLMRRLGDWYMAYCKWEEDNANQYDEEEG